MINTYQNNQWNSRLETKYCYIVQKLRNSGVESSTQKITIDKKEIQYKDKSRRREDESSIRTKHSLSYPPPERQYERKNCLWVGGGKEGGKEREKGYKRRYLVLELEEIKETIQQVEKFVGKNNLTLYYKAAYRLYTVFQHCPNILLNGSMKTIMVNSIRQITNQQFEDLQKAILEATIEHYTNKAMITDTYGFTGAQF
ncbi:hypothetical protein G9A89_009063 [Geosiphon pyriformis]|nr:hypothetical protein G9A89_009063 [Geosiphon pyriformis]